MNDKDYFLIVDYNLTRFNDVKNMSKYAREKYNTNTLLIRCHPNSNDYAITPTVIDLSPRDTQFVDKALKIIREKSYRIKAGIVFSDDAVQSGAALLQSLNVPVDDPHLANNAFSKIQYRRQESKIKASLESQNMFVPAFAVIHNLQELMEFATENKNGFVIKPACEGNNRGVILVDKQCDLTVVFNEVKNYIQDGLICEQLIPYKREFSFDGVGECHFVTQKWSLHSRYPLEKAQILPAQITENEYKQIKSTGDNANLLTGQAGGPFHNEIKLSDDGIKSSIVEPNRRPAGMRIWDLAEEVYGINFYHLWVDSAFAESSKMTLPKAKRRVAILMLNSNIDGRLDPSLVCDDNHFLFNKTVNLFSKRFPMLAEKLSWREFSWMPSVHKIILAEPKDNSQYAASVRLCCHDLQCDMVDILQKFDHCWNQVIAGFIDSLALCA